MGDERTIAGAAEIERVRAVYAERDRRAPRRAQIRAAYALVNEDRHRRVRALVERWTSRSDARLLDVGCGGGWDLEQWLRHGWGPERLAGVDVVARRVDEARARCPGVDIRVVDGGQLPFGDASFDVVTANTVFSSILDPVTRRALFAEMRRVTRPGGLVVIYDFVVRNPANHDVVPMTTSRLRDLGSMPQYSVRLTPFVYGLAAVIAISDRLAPLAMRLLPPTHRLAVWRP